MWPKLIDIILAWWREKPRKDLIINILELRNAMRACNEAYLAYAPTCLPDEPQNRRPKGDYDLYILWRESFGRLDTALAAIDEVLQIFGEDARRLVAGFHSTELDPQPEDGINVGIAAYQIEHDLLYDPASSTMEVGFGEAMAGLDAFIRATFKPEDIVAARRGL